MSTLMPRSQHPSAAHLVSGYRRSRAWMHDLQTRDLAVIESRVHRFVLKVARVLLLVGRLDVVRQLQLSAQALTYDTLLALVPLVIVVFAVVSGFGGLEDLRRRLEELILNNISASDEVRAAVGDYLRRVLIYVRNGSFSALSVVILIYSVLSLLGHIESAINEVFGSKVDRPFLGRLLTYWAALTLGPLLLGASFGITAALQNTGVVSALDQTGIGVGFVQVLPFFVTLIAFTALYMVVPNTHVKPSAAIFAAVVAGSLWNAAKLLYAVYASHALSTKNVYGSLATVPLFILWIYLSWLLVLVGAQLAFAFQHATTYYKDRLALEANQAYRERVACRAFLEIARDFYLGRTPTRPDALAENLGIPRRLLEVVVSDLRDGGLLREVEGPGGGEEGLLPAKDLEHVTVADVVSLFRSGLGVSLSMRDDAGRREIDGILDELDRDLARHAGSVTFRQLAARLHEAGADAGPEAPRTGEAPADESQPGGRPRPDVS
jgi:membrane protein